MSTFLVILIILILVLLLWAGLSRDRSSSRDCSPSIDAVDLAVDLISHVEYSHDNFNDWSPSCDSFDSCDSCSCDSSD